MIASRKPRRRKSSHKLKAALRSKATDRPVETYAVLQQQLKGEDVLFVMTDLGSAAKGRDDLGDWSIYAVCDGHGGSRAAKFVRKHLASALVKVLPAGSPPPAADSEQCEAFCRDVRHALVRAFVSLHDAFGTEGCHISGTTLTVCLVCGWLLTTANVADSEAFLDMGCSIMEMTNCHKVDNNKHEIKRLQAGGADLRRLSTVGDGPALEGDAGRGPLRAWPGGIAMSRSLGDLECDAQIVPVPHVRQMWIPREGARLVMASDGLWDYLSGVKACRLIHDTSLRDAPKRLMEAALSAADANLADDVSILVLDIMSRSGVDFSERRQIEQTSLLRSIQGYIRYPSTYGKLRKAKKTKLLADIDGLVEFPNMSENIVPEICDLPTTPINSEDDTHSRNSSMNSDNWDVCECSWDCSVDSAVSWEKDDRDILDTAQSYVTAMSSSENRRTESVKMILKHPTARRDVDRTESSAMRDFLDTSMTSANASTTMNTIYEPECENDDTTS